MAFGDDHALLSEHGLYVSDKNVANELYSFEHDEVCTNFHGGLLLRGDKPEWSRIKLVIFHIMQSHFLDTLRYVWPMYYNIMYYYESS